MMFIMVDLPEPLAPITATNSVAKPPDVARVEGLAAPLAGVLRKDLEAFAAVEHRPIDREGRAAGH